MLGPDRTRRSGRQTDAVDRKQTLRLANAIIDFERYVALPVGLRNLSKVRTPVAKISKLMKRTIGALRQQALKLGIGLGHQR